jgi:hypothetical protein
LSSYVMLKKLIVFSILVSSISSEAFSQELHRFNPDTLRTIVIDSAVNIKSHRLTAQDFIDAILSDTSFYKAFQNMKRFSFVAENRIYTYDKRNKVDGKIYRKLRHSMEGSTHKMQYLAKRDSGNVFKSNGKYQLYTVEMFDYIFENAYNSDFIKADALPGSGGKNESYKDKLKTLIFTPGRKVKGIPFVSSKTEIFGPDMRQFYYYEFARGTYLDSIPIYRFKVTRKPSIASGDVVIEEMTTIFDMRNFRILGRTVNLKYSNFLLSFDVKMDIELNRFNDILLPTKITYQGTWDVPFHKVERASFFVVHKDYKLN